MLSVDDAAIVERDPALPGLGILLDPEAFVAGMRPRWDVDASAEIFYLRYKPHTSCLAGYRVRLAGVDTLVTARAHRLDTAAKFAGGASGGGQMAFQPYALKHQAIVATLFPHDRRLPELIRLADENSRRELWQRLFPTRREWWTGELQLLRYKPERRLVGRLMAGGQPVAVVKFYGAGDYQHVCSGTKRLRSGATLCIPHRIAKSNRCQAAAFEWLAGCPLDESMTHGEFSPEDMQRVGAALGELHAQRNERAKRLTPAAESRAILEAAVGLDWLCPEFGNRAQDLARKIVDEIQRMPRHTTAVHGDFHPGQVLLQDESVALVDLDAASRGDPAADLGNFLAHLNRAVFPGVPPSQRAGDLGEALLRGYPDPSVHDRLDVWTAAGLMRLAPHAFRSRAADWKNQTTQILDQVEEVLTDRKYSKADTHRRVVPAGLAESEASPKVEDCYGVAADPQMPFVRNALDPTEVCRRLAPLAVRLPGAKFPIGLRAIRVTRYKPQRRGMVEYELAGDGGFVTIIGKARAKGLDRRTHRLVESLRRAGFDESATDCICVPRPLGTVPAWEMWFQEKVAGVVATPLLAGPDGPRLAGRIAEAIHKLHKTGVPTHRTHTMADEMRILSERLGELARARPAWSSRLERIVGACARLAASAPETGRCGIHRDFYPDQVLVSGERLYLLDLDLYCQGDPALDIGNFRAHLMEQALRTLGHPAAFCEAERSLTDRYLELSGGRRWQAVDVYTTLALARHIFISTRFPERSPLTGQLLELCELRLASVGRAG
jgi:aminoglycoside phosphotransferase (APT) family kinase protein